MSIAIGPSTEHLTELSWDTANFGFPVSRIEAYHLDDDELRAALRAARMFEQKLVYVFASADRELPPALLRDFGGRLVDRKANFELDLAHAPELPDDPAFEILTFGESKPDASLIELALASGTYSRFRVDPQFPSDKFEAMMRTWIARLTAGQLADAVLVARLPGKSKNLAFNAPLLTDGVGRSTLVAVAEEVRGRGLGTQIMAAVHRWLIRRGASRAVVCTQLDNVPACRLYQKAGYQLANVENVFHFWV